MSKTELNPSRWLEAHCDRNADLITLPNNLVLSDVSGDGDCRLVLADLKLENELSARLKVYKGPVLISDQPLPDVVSGVISFYTDNFESKLPVIGVACGSDLLIYKNNKPFFKFSLPSLPITAFEQDLWQKLTDDNYDQFIKDLQTIPYHSLTPRSQSLLTLPSTEKTDYVDRYRNIELTKCSPIICMTTIKRNSEDPFSTSCPVLATESGQIYILDPQTYTILHEARVSNTKATPSVIRLLGTFEIEFRILVACRERYVTLLRRGWLEGKNVFQTTASIIDMILIPGDKFIVVAGSDKMMNCYTKRGNKVWSVKMPQHITCLCLVNLKYLSVSLIAVGMQGGAIHLYQNRHAVDYISAPDTPSAITFGQLGQEEHVMIIVTIGGTLNFKILKRTADFNLNQESSVSPNFQNKPLPLPKRSKLFLEQSIRERQNAIEMHQSFQQDMIRLRLNAARSMVQLHGDQTGTGNQKEQLKLSAQVLGLGPLFTLILTLENMNSEKAVIELSAVFHCNPTIYNLSTYYMPLPLIPPGLGYKMETKVTECFSENNVTEDLENNNVSTKIIRVFIIRKEQVQPVLAATINMPPTDPLGYTI